MKEKQGGVTIEEIVEKGIGAVTDEDIAKVFGQRTILEEMCKKGSLARLWDKIKILISMVADYFSGGTRTCPEGLFWP